MYREKLEKKRVELGFSIRYVAKKSNIAYATAYDVLNSNITPRIDTVEKIATTLGMSLTEIF